MGILIYLNGLSMRFEKINGSFLSYYTGYFHDGVILNITNTNNDLSIEMESVAMYLCDNRDNIPFSKRNTLYGILHARGIHTIRLNKKEVASLELQHEYGSLLRFDITDSSFSMCGHWEGPGITKNTAETWFHIEVKATEVYWENTADTQDPALLGKYMGYPGKPPYGYPQWYIDKYGPQENVPKNNA